MCGCQLSTTPTPFSRLFEAFLTALATRCFQWLSQKNNPVSNANSWMTSKVTLSRVFSIATHYLLIGWCRGESSREDDTEQGQTNRFRTRHSQSAIGWIKPSAAITTTTQKPKVFGDDPGPSSNIIHSSLLHKQ